MNTYQNTIGEAFDKFKIIHSNQSEISNLLPSLSCFFIPSRKTATRQGGKNAFSGFLDETAYKNMRKTQLPFRNILNSEKLDHIIKGHIKLL